ncbi:hypothetical protein P8C59_009349 [Phyllachora maydis]|uniref:Tetraspanin n=1 Tax=Phyllachora maydis TaxID=1825666 RepID=A0AAD9IEQ5_9PEZI|nr:hypothetical protein P8C59_009349 [Phyllachora maydis]
MANKVLLAYVAADVVFVSMGVIMIVFSITVGNIDRLPPNDGTEAARDLLYQRFPLTAGIVNAIFVFATFLVTLPGIITPARGWTTVGIWMTTICSVFSTVLGLYIWVQTLRTKEDFASIWAAQPFEIQDLMQTAFNCCGYFNSTSPAFITDATCPSPAAAALMKGCATPITSYANIFVDQIFTSVFGMVGVNVLFIVAAACLLKERKERERFRHIDEKSGFGSL